MKTYEDFERWMSDNGYHMEDDDIPDPFTIWRDIEGLTKEEAREIRPSHLSHSR